MDETDGRSKYVVALVPEILLEGEKAVVEERVAMSASAVNFILSMICLLMLFNFMRSMGKLTYLRLDA